MPLKLILRAVPDQQLNTPAPAHVGDMRSVTETLSIGRAPVNDWVLVDPLLSKTHCTVTLRRGRYVLADLSTNGVFVNGAKQRVAKGSPVALSGGDSFTLGGFVIAVEEPAAPRHSVDGHSVDGDSVDGDGVDGDGVDGDGVDGDSVDEGATIATVGHRRPRPAEDTGQTLPPGLPPAGRPGARSPFDEPASPPTRRPRPPASPAVGDAARLVAAFLDGAGVATGDAARDDPEAYMRSMGALMRLMIERVRDILMARAEIKQELGVEVTLLRARNNNPLKFAVTAEDAVTALLLPGRAGYLPPLQAAGEALDDIEQHQRAVVAGAQAALVELLRRFDPAALETRLVGGSILDAILPAARKARFWELFCAMYQDIAEEAEADLGVLFGDEFARGYRRPGPRK